MGVLDDAIREHLDLKRKQGVDEDELKRQQEEALGPARREAGPAEATDEEGADAEVDTGAEAEPVAEAPVAEAPVDEEPVEEAQVEEEPVESVVDTPPEPETAVDEDEPAEEDPLEDTPDFLQETPEHDRLWFEQKPPRDFDFD